LFESKEEERKADKDGYDNERINHHRPSEVMDYQLLILRKLFQLYLLLLFQYFTDHSEIYFDRRSGILLKLLTLTARQKSGDTKLYTVFNAGTVQTSTEEWSLR
jgi:hypothetical protein